MTGSEFLELWKVSIPAIIAFIVLTGGIVSTVLAFNLGKRTEAHKTALAIQSKRFELRYTKYHDKLMMGIEQLFVRLSALIDEVQSITSLVPNDLPSEDRVNKMLKRFRLYCDAYRKAIIYLPDDLDESLIRFQFDLNDAYHVFTSIHSMNKAGYDHQEIGETIRQLRELLGNARNIQRQLRLRFHAMVEAEVKPEIAPSPSFFIRFARWWDTHAVHHDL